MKIFVCQTAPKVGALEENFKIVQKNYEEAVSNDIDICVFPELCISGYLAEDLFLRRDFIISVEAINDQLVKATKQTCILLPTLLFENNNLYNVVIAAQNGKIIGITYKNELPNYGVFDEKRYFKAGIPSVITINETKIGVPICEDIWHSQICLDLKQQGAELFIIPNASPYEKDKLNNRIRLVENRFKETQIPIIYANQALAHDGIIFDGRSFLYDGELTVIGKDFETNSTVVDYANNKFNISTPYAKTNDIYEEIYKATILGVRDYVHDNGFNKVILGLSGGIDSAIVSVIAAKALGAENISCYMLPSKFTSDESLQDASLLATNLGLSLDLVSIQKIVDQFTLSLSSNNEIEQKSITYQNLQSRTRGALLMALANNANALLLTTGNKSEYATGYATIYGDMNGAFNPIKDLYKTEIFELAKYINAESEIIPNNIINKEPSAELGHNQKDTDSLPNYDVLDQILEQLIEQRNDPKSLYSKYDKYTVEKIAKLLQNSEFKRQQSAPGVKISSMSFDKDRRFSITNFYKIN